MVNEMIKATLEGYIYMKQGVKAVTLASDEEVLKLLGNESFHDVMEELISENRVVEIEYTVPSMPYRLKSFYLPGGSVVVVRGQQESIDK